MVGDAVNEPNETFTVNLSGAVNGTISTATGNGTIVNDDSAPGPVVSTVSPASGSAGTSVTITGSGFTGATAVTFNGIIATSFTVNSSTQITAIAPAGAGSGPIGITTPAGSTTGGTFTVTCIAPVASTTTPAVCAGGTIVLNASTIAGAGYSWTGPNGFTSTLQNPTVVSAGTTASGTYSVTATVGSCTSAASPVSVTVNPAPTATISGPSVVCPGSSATLDAGPFASYAWSTGATTRTITVTPTATTTYSVTVTDANGCTATASRTVSLASSGTATISTSPSVSAGSANNNASVVPGPAGSTYSWTVTGGTITSGNGTPSIIWSAGVGTTATISVNVSSGVCSSAGTVSVSIFGADLALTASVFPTSIGSGGTATFTLDVINNGPTMAQNVGVDILLTNATLVSATGQGWSCTPQGGHEICYSASLNAGPAGSIAVTVTAGSNGTSASASATISSSTSDQNPGNNSAAAAVTISVPTDSCPQAGPRLLAPTNAAANLFSPITFSWSAVSGATGYRLWLALDNGAAQDAGLTDAATTTLALSLNSTNVLWYVEVMFTSCPSRTSDSFTFTIQHDPCANRELANLISPVDQSTALSSSLQFRWTAVPHADGYRVWASIDGGDFSALNTASTSTTLDATIGSGAVAWFVEALFNGCASTESLHRIVNVPARANCGSNTATALVSPPKGSVVTSGATDFTWSAAPGAVEYQLWLGLKGSIPSLLGSTQSTSLHRNIPAGELEWFIRTLFNGCPAIDSAKVVFSFTPPAICNATPPILTAPGDSVTLASSVDFQWGVVPAAQQFKVWVSVNHSPATLLGTTSVPHLDRQNVPLGAIDWYVEALFDGCSAQQSTTGSFTIVPPPPPCQVPDPPSGRADATVSSNVHFKLRWSPIANAVSYEIQESDSAAFSVNNLRPVSDHELSFQHQNTTSVPVIYYYRIRAISACNGERSLFSAPVLVSVLPETTDGSSPADDPQSTSNHIVLGGNGPSSNGFVAAAVGTTFVATTDEPWLTITPASGIVPPGGIVLNVTANPNGLPIGTSTGAVHVSFGATSQSAKSPKGDPTTTTTNISISLVQPVAPKPKNTPPPDALIIPAVAHADGLHATFQSDIRVTNTSTSTLKYQLTFTPTGDDGIKLSKQSTIDVAPGKTVGLDDVLDSWFGASASVHGASGMLEIRPLNATSASTSSKAVAGLANLVTFAGSRTYSITGNGTLGQYVPAIPFANFIGRGTDATRPAILSLQQISQSSAFRTNLGLVEGSGEPANVLVTVFSAGGQKLTSFAQSLQGGQHLQLNGVLAARNVSVTDGRIEVQVLSPAGKVTTYASVIDNKTNDPMLVAPVAINTKGDLNYVLPGLVDVSSSIATQQTDVRLFNASAAAVTAALSFYPEGDGGNVQRREMILAPSEVKTIDGAVQSLFGLTNANGALHIDTASAVPLVATARTYNQTDQGTYGQFIQAVTPADAASKGTRALQILDIEESNRYHSDIGLVEVSGKPAKVEISVTPADAKFSVSTVVDLGANQVSTFRRLLKGVGLDNTYNARVTVRVIDGEGKVTAYGSVTDARTNDPTFIPAQ